MENKTSHIIFLGSFRLFQGSGLLCQFFKHGLSYHGLIFATGVLFTMFNLENLVADLHVGNVSHVNIIVYFFLVSPNCNLAYILLFSQPTVIRQRLLNYRLHHLFLLPKNFLCLFRQRCRSKSSTFLFPRHIMHILSFRFGD